jgi:phytoene dehydrogenase-like protein
LSHLQNNHYPFPFSAAYLLSLPQRGLYSPYEKILWITSLHKVFKDIGGVLMDRCSVMRIDANSRITIDVETQGTANTLRSNQLVVSTQWEKIKLLLFHQKVFRRLLRKLDSVHPMLYPFTLHLGVDARGLPESLAPCVIVLGRDTEAAVHQNLIYLISNHPGEIDYAPAGKRAVTATVFLKDSPLLLDDTQLKGIAKTIIDSLEIFLPFLRESIDFVNIEKSIALSRSSQEIINKKYCVQKGKWIGIATFSPKTPLKNVFMTGGLLRSGLGFNGEILAGFDTANCLGKEIEEHG